MDNSGVSASIHWRHQKKITEMFPAKVQTRKKQSRERAILELSCPPPGSPRRVYTDEGNTEVQKGNKKHWRN